MLDDPELLKVWLGKPMTNRGPVTVRKGESNDREEQVESAQRSLKQTLTGLIDDPSLPEPTKIRAIIH